MWVCFILFYQHINIISVGDIIVSLIFRLDFISKLSTHIRSHVAAIIL